MAKLTRYTFKQFGMNANPISDIGIFGSLAAGSPTFSNSITLIQSLTAWITGWAAETISVNRPAMEDQNAVDFVFAYMIAQIFQDGIAEYDSGTTYYTGSIVKVGSQIYQSLQDNNTGNTPSSSPTYWQAGLPSSEITGVIKGFGGTVAPSGYLICDGSAISRVTYANLFSVLGTTYGIGDGSTTFNIPDLRGNVPVGYKSGDGSFGTLGGQVGEKTHTLTVPEIPSHTHGLNESGATGAGTPAPTGGGSSAFTGATGGDGAHNNIQPSLVINYIIKT